MSAGKLREDLLYRLNVFPIPCLRCGSVATTSSRWPIISSPSSTRPRAPPNTSPRRPRAPCAATSGRGNLRELKNVIHHAFIVADTEIGLDELGETTAGKKATGKSLTMSVGTPLVDAERRLILAALDQFDGDKKKVASALQISVATLYTRLNEYKSH